jgi:hypothetical protein
MNQYPCLPPNEFPGGGLQDQNCKQNQTPAAPPAPDRAKRLECVQLAAALGWLTSAESAGKPDALHTLRDFGAS